MALYKIVARCGYVQDGKVVVHNKPGAEVELEPDLVAQLGSRVEPVIRRPEGYDPEQWDRERAAGAQASVDGQQVVVPPEGNGQIPEPQVVEPAASDLTTAADQGEPAPEQPAEDPTPTPRPKRDRRKGRGGDDGADPSEDGSEPGQATGE